VALSFLYRLVHRVLEAIRIHRMDEVAKDGEILVLRHQLAVLTRQVARPRFTWSDRALVGALAPMFPRERWTSFFVTPETIFRWHRAFVRRRWTYLHRKPGRPALPQETVELIVRLARENPRWGYLRIVGELKKLDVAVSKTSVAAVLRAHGLPPAPRRYLERVPSLPSQGHLGNRLLGVTANPSGPWVTQVARNFASELEDAGRHFRFLIRDRDTKFIASFDTVLSSIGIETIRTPVASPQANAFAERFVRTVRQECLDHLLVVSQQHLEVLLGEYVRHYNEARPHRSLDLDQPLPRPATSTTAHRKVIRRDVLDGIVHEYEGAA
jgi:putative transposase